MLSFALVTASLCSLQLAYAQPKNNTVSVGGETSPNREHCFLTMTHVFVTIAFIPVTDSLCCDLSTIALQEMASAILLSLTLEIILQIWRNNFIASFTCDAI